MTFSRSSLRRSGLARKGTESLSLVVRLLSVRLFRGFPLTTVHGESPVELIGAMTWPINVAEELKDAQILGELKQSVDYTTLIDAQLSYKSAILRSGSLRHIMRILANSLEKSRR